MGRTYFEKNNFLRSSAFWGHTCILYQHVKLCELSKLKFCLSSILCGIVVHCTICLVGFVLGRWTKAVNMKDWGSSSFSAEHTTQCCALPMRDCLSQGSIQPAPIMLFAFGNVRPVLGKRRTRLGSGPADDFSGRLLERDYSQRLTADIGYRGIMWIVCFPAALLGCATVMNIYSYTWRLQWAASKKEICNKDKVSYKQPMRWAWVNRGRC
jgi:hypothetical protein